MNPNQQAAISKEPEKRQHHSPQMKARFVQSFAIIPISLWMIILVAIPLLYVIYLSFLQRGITGGIELKPSFDNYLRMGNPLYFKVFWDSIFLAFITTLLTLLLGYPFAYFVAKLPQKIRLFIMILMMVPFWTNSLIRTYGWMILLRTDGLINQFLIKLGFLHEPLKMLYNYGSVLVGMVYVFFPFMVLPIYASLEKLDKSYLEAAKDLGANNREAFLSVTLPLTLPGIIAGCILVFVPTIGFFFIPDLMGGSKVMLIGNLIRNQFLISRDWPFGAALSIVMMILAYIFIGAFNRMNKNKVKTEASDGVQII
jgi:ABC-type spermidine/putrescine transport system, permease component I